MPNWCENWMKVGGNGAASFLEELKQHGFGAVIPEPKYENDEDWYEWRVDNWGTKWDIDQEWNFTLDLPRQRSHFLTAWAPPLAWLAAASTATVILGNAKALLEMRRLEGVEEEQMCSQGGGQ